MSVHQRLCFIVNPFSGGGKTKGIEQQIQKYLDHEKYHYQIQTTNGPGHATTLAKDAVKANFDMIIAVGGDGTVNEVAAGVINSATIMGIIPAGSGNGLAMHLGIGRNMTQAIQILNDARSITIDTCLLNERPYINLAGIGFDAEIAYQTSTNKIRGFIGYVYQSIKSALFYPFSTYDIQIDQQHFQQAALLIEVANAPMFGYNFTIAPLAKLNDGLLEIVIVEQAAKWRYLFMLHRFLNSSLHKSRLVKRYTAKSVTIKLTSPSAVHVDGEGYLMDRDLQFSINPLSLNVIVHPNYSI